MRGTLRLRDGIGGAPLRVLLRPLAVARLPGADLGDPLVDRDLEPLGRARRVVEVRERDPRKAHPDRSLDGPQIGLLIGRHEGKRVARQLGPGRPADAVDVVIGDVRHVEIDDV